MPQTASNTGTIVYRQKLVVGLGEILWDHVRGVSRLGGAPAKMNEHEAPRVLDLLHPPPGGAAHSGAESRTHHQIAHRLLRDFPALKMVCITLGDKGSLLVTRHTSHHHHGVGGTVVDTVGAGDAFTGALVHYFLDGAPLPVLNEAGNRWGSWVASQRGAVPPLDAETLYANARAIAKAG